MKFTYLCFDWKEQPDIKAISEIQKYALLGLGYSKEAQYSGGDWYYIILSSEEITDKEANFLMKTMEEQFHDFDPDWEYYPPEWEEEPEEDGWLINKIEKMEFETYYSSLIEFRNERKFEFIELK